jgi:hypothetical protein
MIRRHYLSMIMIFCALNLAACTTYQPEGFTGGFSETPLARNAYQIQTKGNSFASASLVRNIALVRAAELTLDKGFHSFVILDQEDWEKTVTLTSPGTFNSTTRYYGNSAHTSGNYSGPQDISTPRTNLVVRMFDKGEPGSEDGLLPMEIIRSVGPQVKYQGPYLLESTK